MKIKNSKRFNKLLLIIRLVLTSKTSWIYTESALQKKKKKKTRQKKNQKKLIFGPDTTLSSDSPLRFQKNVLE